nr:hypothetical protein [Saccharopolyspora shandongensis]
MGLGADTLLAWERWAPRTRLFGGQLLQPFQQGGLALVVEEGAGHPGSGGDRSDGDPAAVMFQVVKDRMDARDAVKATLPG